MPGIGPARLGPFRQEYERARKLIIASQDICGICGQPVDKTLKYPDPMSPTVDHIIPLAKGGHPSDLSNLQLAHRKCNRLKSDRIGVSVEPEKKKSGFQWSVNWLDYRGK